MVRVELEMVRNSSECFVHGFDSHAAWAMARLRRREQFKRSNKKLPVQQSSGKKNRESEKIGARIDHVQPQRGSQAWPS